MSLEKRNVITNKEKKGQKCATRKIKKISKYFNIPL